MVSRHQQCPLLSGLTAVFVLSSFIAFTNNHAHSQTGRTIKVVVPYPASYLRHHGAHSDGRDWPRTGAIDGRREPAWRKHGDRSVEAVARATPDGGTLLVATTALIINAHLRKLNYHPLTSFEPVCNLTSSPLVLVVKGTSAYHSLGDLLNAAGVKPGSLTVAGVGPASTVHIAFELLKRAAGVDITFVPYWGPRPR